MRLRGRTRDKEGGGVVVDDAASVQQNGKTTDKPKATTDSKHPGPLSGSQIGGVLVMPPVKPGSVLLRPVVVQAPSVATLRRRSMPPSPPPSASSSASSSSSSTSSDGTTSAGTTDGGKPATPMTIQNTLITGNETAHHTSHFGRGPHTPRARPLPPVPEQLRQKPPATVPTPVLLRTSTQNFAQVVMMSSPSLPTTSKPDSPVAKRKINEQNQPQPAMSKMSLRQVAAEEILSSEQTYVDQIHICIENYKKPIEASKLVDEKVVRDLFANVETIYALHVDFLTELKTRMQRWTSPTEHNNIGDVMIRLIPYLKIYQEYINNYENSIKVLNKLLDKNAKFVQLLNCLGTGSFIGRLGLELLRGVPVQRITRYVLLLKQLLKYTPEDHVDYAQLSESYTKMYALAEYINEKKRESESRTRLMHIAHHLTGNLDVRPKPQRIIEPVLTMNAVPHAQKQLRESDSTPQITRQHKWKTENKSKPCDYCGQMAMGSHLRCKHDNCKYRVHEECKSKAPEHCSDRTKVSLVKHNRFLVEEAEFMHKMASLEHPDSRAKLKPTLVLIVNDGLVIVHKTEHSDKYTLLAFVRWYKKSTDEHAILNEHVTELAFSVTDPRTHMLHTFSTESKEKKEHFVELIRSLMDKWHANILEKQRETDEIKEQFKGLSFKILFTVPVHSSTEKEFIAYVVELRMESGSATLIKRYRQFLSLHKKLKTLYKNVPKFPGKKYVGNTAPKFVQKRCRRLEEYLNQVVTFPGIFDIEEVRTFLMTTISSKGEDEKALINRGWSKDKEKIEEISRQRSNTVSGYLETVKRLSVAQPYRASVAINSSGSYVSQSSDHSTPTVTASPQKATGSEIITASGERATRTAPLGAMSRLTRGEGQMSEKEMALWKRLEERSEQSETAQPHSDEPQKGKHNSESAETASGTTEERERAVALYDFVRESKEELDMIAGDVVEIWERSNDEWWFGTINGRDFGFFPKAYVQLLSFH